MKYINALIVLAAGLSLVSCGGGGGSSAVSSRKGSVIVSIQWPKPTRLIPDAANKITVTFTPISGGTVGTFTVDKPTATVQFSNFDPGAYTVNAIATKDSGPALAVGSAPINIEPKPDNTFSVTMATEVDNLRYSTDNRTTYNDASTPISLPSDGSVTLDVSPSKGAGAGAVLLDVGASTTNFATSTTGNISATTGTLNGSNLHTVLTATGSSGVGSLKVDYKDGGGLVIKSFVLNVNITPFTLTQANSKNFTNLVLNDLSKDGALLRSTAQDVFVLDAAGATTNGDSVAFSGGSGSNVNLTLNPGPTQNAIRTALSNATGQTPTVTGTGPWTITFTGGEMNFFGTASPGVLAVNQLNWSKSVTSPGAVTFSRPTTTTGASIVPAASNFGGSPVQLDLDFAHLDGNSRMSADVSGNFYVTRGSASSRFSGLGAPPAIGVLNPFASAPIDLTAASSTEYYADTTSIHAFAGGTTVTGGPAFTNIRAIAAARDTIHSTGAVYMWVLDGSNLTRYVLGGTNISNPVVISTAAGQTDIAAQDDHVYVLNGNNLDVYTADGSVILLSGFNLAGLGATGNFSHIAASPTQVFVGSTNGTNSSVVTLTHP